MDGEPGQRWREYLREVEGEDPPSEPEEHGSDETDDPQTTWFGEEAEHVEGPGPDGEDSPPHRDGPEPSEQPREEAGERPTSPSERPEERKSRPSEAANEIEGGATKSASVPTGGDEWLEQSLAELQEEARRAGRRDAEIGEPPLDGAAEPSEGERSLRERCRAVFGRWVSRERRRANDRIGQLEETISEKLGQADLKIDRFERLTNELIRLKAKLTSRRREVSEQLEEHEDEGREGLSTKVYLAIIAFLGSVEFFANAPVFRSLLPRDPLTQQQIEVVTETAQGWSAGLERVVANIVFRPDAALLAAGVITFLCVLAHFFGHHLRDLVRQKDEGRRQDMVSGRSQMENWVPIILSGLGLVLVLGVLYHARVILGDVGQERYQEDMAQVEELRRQAGWLRSDGDLLEANQRINQADDLEQAAEDLRNYAQSMSRMSFPILLLNLTLVLSAIAAAYSHRKDARGSRFNEEPFEDERRSLIDESESVADEISDLLSDVVRHIRRLRGVSEEQPLQDWRAVKHRLEGVIQTYRAENARARERSTQTIPAFQGGVSLDLGGDELSASRQNAVNPQEYADERRQLAQRFQKARKRFNEQAMSWWRGDD